MTRYFVNAPLLFKTIFRRDAVRMAIWFFAITAFGVSVAAAYPNLYPSEAERMALGETMRNPAMIAMVGHPYGVDNYTVAAMYANQMLVFMLITTGVMSIMMVVRHTRSNEDEGIMEIIRAFPVGRMSNLAATLLALVVLNFLIGAGYGGLLVIIGIESITPAHALTFGGAIMVSGIFFGTLAAVFVQLFDHSRAALIWSFMTLIGLYILRAIGDVSLPALSWASPLGWIMHSEVMVNNYIWPLGLVALLSVALTSLAFKLNSMRDLGSGFFHGKDGRAEAPKSLLSPLGLTLRLQRTTLIAWGITVFILGASYGSIFGDLDAFLSENQAIMDLIPDELAGDITLQFLIVIMQVIAITAAIGPLLVMLKLSSEEKKYRTEALYATSMKRTHNLAAHLTLAVVVSGIFLLGGALGTFVTIAVSMDDPIAIKDVVGSVFVHWPPIFFMIGLSTLLVGAFPEKTVFVWIYLIYSFIAIYFGTLLDLPPIIERLTPFGYVPSYPIEAFEGYYALVSVMLGIALGTCGFILYKRRDLLG